MKLLLSPEGLQALDELVWQRPLLAFERGPGAVRELAAAVAGWLEAPEDLRAATRDAMVAITRERYSWDGVARTLVEAAEGRLDGLPAP